LSIHFLSVGQVDRPPIVNQQRCTLSTFLGRSGAVGLQSDEMLMSGAPPLRDRISKAAQRVVLRDGVAGMSMRKYVKVEDARKVPS
jgi:hypothetical protein